MLENEHIWTIHWTQKKEVIEELKNEKTYLQMTQPCIVKIVGSQSKNKNY